MSNLLNFITSFGSIAELRSLSKDDLKKVMIQHGLTEQEITVLLNGDKEEIVKLVKDSEEITCAILVPEKPEDEPKPDEEPQPEPEEEKPSSRLVG